VLSLNLRGPLRASNSSVNIDSEFIGLDGLGTAIAAAAEVEAASQAGATNNAENVDDFDGGDEGACGGGAEEWKITRIAPLLELGKPVVVEVGMHMHDSAVPLRATPALSLETGLLARGVSWAQGIEGLLEACSKLLAAAPSPAPQSQVPAGSLPDDSFSCGVGGLSGCQGSERQYRTCMARYGQRVWLLENPAMALAVPVQEKLQSRENDREGGGGSSDSNFLMAVNLQYDWPARLKVDIEAGASPLEHVHQIRSTLSLQWPERMLTFPQVGRPGTNHRRACICLCSERA
jgi:hypothetical protein